MIDQDREAGTVPAHAHSSISRSPPELPAARIGRRPSWVWMLVTLAAPFVRIAEDRRGAPNSGRPSSRAEFVPDQRPDDELGWHAVQVLADGPNELGAAAGDQPDREVESAEFVEQLEHRLVHDAADRAAEGAVFRSLP